MSSGSIILSWNEAKDKKVKSSDDKDLGKIQNVTRDYIEIKEGLIAKKTYFIPKYYVQGYDGDSIWISLRKEDTKQGFERESPPQDMSEFETPDYVQRRESVKKQYPDFDNTIPRYTPIPGTSSASTTVPAPPSTKMVSVPWDKLKGKKVKSKDNSDVGKVEEVAPHYVEVKEGLIAKKSYFIPKYYIEYFDGDKLQTSLSKDEIKSKWERDTPPSEAEIQTEEYQEQKKKVDEQQPQFLHGVPFMAPEPGVTTRSDITGEEVNIEWAEVIHKHVRASDNIDVGDVERVGNEFIVVRQGVAKIHHYYIPKACISNYDGSSLYLNVPSDFVRAKFERDTEPTSEEIQTLVREAGTRAEEQKRIDAFKEKEKGNLKDTSAGKDEDPLTSYREKEPMTPAKIKEHEPTAVKREMTEKIVERGQTGTNPEEARKKGMAKGIAGVSETGNGSDEGSTTAPAMSSKSDESTPGVSAQFSCGFCNKTYKSREELKQHSTQEHSKAR
ncbi:hypothetical protein BH18THE2_BH18THE2_40160 [soil metagenome]